MIIIIVRVLRTPNAEIPRRMGVHSPETISTVQSIYSSRYSVAARIYEQKCVAEWGWSCHGHTFISIIITCTAAYSRACAVHWCVRGIRIIGSVWTREWVSRQASVNAKIKTTTKTEDEKKMSICIGAESALQRNSEQLQSTPPRDGAREWVCFFFPFWPNYMDVRVCVCVRENFFSRYFSLHLCSSSSLRFDDADIITILSFRLQQPPKTMMPPLHGIVQFRCCYWFTVGKIRNRPTVRFGNAHMEMSHTHTRTHMPHTSYSEFACDRTHARHRQPTRRNNSDAIPRCLSR